MISDICKKAGLGFQENELLTADDLLLADEAFLAGDLYGIQWIKAYESKRYLNKTIRLLNEQLNTIVPTKQP
jgi:branched-subunit amino acid aminotransferase/4-amino-4-deoxychorismate lyase